MKRLALLGLVVLEYGHGHAAQCSALSPCPPPAVGIPASTRPVMAASRMTYQALLRHN